MLKLYKQFKHQRKYYDSLAQMVYLSNWFSPIYELINFPRRIYNLISKFIYYGKAGTKCYDYDASSIHVLINAHIKRVEVYMKSDATHLEWNSKDTSGNMKRLREFSELCSRMVDNELNENYFLGKEIEKYGHMFDRKNLVEDGEFFVVEESKEADKAKRIAIKKDRIITKHLTERYYYMLEKYVPGFWD